MTKKNQPSKDQVSLFYESMQGVTRPKNKHNKVVLNKKNTAHPAKPSLDEPHLISPSTQHLDIPPVSSETPLSYKQPSISNKILRNLNKGQYNVDAILDLHGLTVVKAQSALEQFLQQCLSRHYRVVLIIHGKSRSRDKPILKNKLNEWLRQINDVLAFCSAQPAHGNRGALYVLLRRHTEENLLG